MWPHFPLLSWQPGGKLNVLIVFYFSAFGCSNPTPPADGFVDRRGDHAIITCQSNNAQWEMTCRDGEWQGYIGDCSESKHNKMCIVCQAILINESLCKINSVMFLFTI